MNELPKPETLLNFSDTTLQDLLLASRDRESRHIKAAKIELDEAAREGAIALAAEWALQYRAELAGMEGRTEREEAA